MKKRKIAAVVTAAMLLMTACQSGSVSKDDETEEETSRTEESDKSEGGSGAGGLSGLINDILNGETNNSSEPDTASAVPVETTVSDDPDQPDAAETTAASTTASPDDDLYDEPNIAEMESLYQPSGNAGIVKYLGYYDITRDLKGYEQCLIFQSDMYGGTIEYISSPYGEAFYEKLSLYIASDDSPDLVEKSVMLYPGNISTNLFEPLDGKIDIDSPLWKDMKDVAESFSWGGNHYYYPHCITTSFALNYSKKTIADNGLPDPYTLYMNGEWTWEAWREIMIRFCDMDEKNIGFYATDSTINGFVLTTGTPWVDVLPNGHITNNLQSSNVTRAMQFVESLYRDGLSYDKQYGDWVPPTVFATNCDRLLFLCMEPEWTYIAATETIQNSSGVENDIFDTVSDFAFVPFPRDAYADAYYQGYETFGYLIPKGAKNMSGALEFINLNRAYEVDPVVQEHVRNDHIAPEKVYYTSGKYDGQQKWQITWGEQEYDLWKAMSDPANFTFVNEDAFGFSSEFQSELAAVVMDVVEDGASWTQKSAQFSPVVDAMISQYYY